MAVAELNFKPRILGRAKALAEVAFVRELGDADMAMLELDRGIKPPAIKTLRDRHHALARCLALGMSHVEAAAVTGYTTGRISILNGDASFKELVAHYRDAANSASATYQDRAVQAAQTALDIITERLEDTPEDITLGQALEIAKQLGDRTGNAPLQRIQQTNVNIDLGGRLAAARLRVAGRQ